MATTEATKSILKSLAPYLIEKKKIELTPTVLGRGAFGVVTLGELGRRAKWWNTRKRTLVAVKQLHATGTPANDRKMDLALVQELRVWAGLAHPNIAPLVGFCLDDRSERLWIVSQYTSNGNIHDYLLKQLPGMFTRLRMLGGIASAIAYIHRRNLYHGNIKGANVLVDDFGNAKLCDFGLTKLIEGRTTLKAVSAGPKGTTRYTAPECFSGDHPIGSKKGDVWAWSCLGPVILFDRKPYGGQTVDMAIRTRIMRGDPPIDLDSVKVDGSIKQLFKQCWVAKPEDRVDIDVCVNVMKRVLEATRLQAVTSVKPDKPRSIVQRLTRLRSTGHTSMSSTTHMGNSSMSTYAVPSTDSHRATDISHRRSQKAVKIIVDEDDIPLGNIERYRQQLLRRPTAHIEWCNSLHGIALSLRDKYHKNGNVVHLEEAIGAHRQVLLLRPLGHPERHNSLYHLALSLFDKYRSRGEVATLNESIDVHRQVLLLRPKGHPERHNSLFRVAVSVMEKYGKEGRVALLDEVIEVYWELLRHPEYPERDRNLHNLGVSLREKYRQQGNIKHLLESIQLDRQALILRPGNHPKRDSSLHNIALSLLDKFRIQDDTADLEEATEFNRQALLLRPEGHPKRHLSLYSLALALSDKHRKQADIAVANEAIDINRHALLLQPEGHPERHSSLYTLAVSLREKYIGQGDIASLNEAIEVYREVLLLRPVGHPERLAGLQGLGESLQSRLDREHRNEDLSEAIATFQHMLALRPVGHQLNSDIRVTLRRMMAEKSGILSTAADGGERN